MENKRIRIGRVKAKFLLARLAPLTHSHTEPKA